MFLDGKKKSPVGQPRPRGRDNRYSRFSDRSRSRDSSPGRFSHFRPRQDNRGTR